MTMINIIDAPCGRGKSSWAIQYMNEAPAFPHKFIYVTPFLEQVTRIKESVRNRSFYDPFASNGKTKLEDLHRLLGEGKDICTTHALFQLANEETRELIRINGYILILDEVLNVIEQIPLRKDDLKLLEDARAIKIVEKDRGIKYIEWNPETSHFDTKYNKIKQMALSGNLMYCDNSALIWNFPCEIFSYFQHVFVLTYLFKGQIQKSYYDLHGIKYKYLSVIEEKGRYELVPYDCRIDVDKEELRSLINIYEGKLNDVGDRRNSLSKSWFENREYKNAINTLKNNTRNYFMNILRAKANEVLWTTIQGAKGKNKKGKLMSKVVPHGYVSSFISMTLRATNQFRDKRKLAYLVNRYINPVEKMFFKQYGISIDEDTWALSEMIQWVWRSAIRDGKSIDIYIPSKRMRLLFQQYLNSYYFEEVPREVISSESPSDWNL